MKHVDWENQIPDTQCKPGAIKNLLKDTAQGLAVLLLTIAFGIKAPASTTAMVRVLNQI